MLLFTFTPRFMRGVINWLLLASVALAGLPAQAATFTVTILDDSGPGSLRQAVIDANATAITDTIVFQAGLTGTIILTSGEIGITSRLTITGPGETVLAISGNGASRVFYTNSASATIQQLTIKDGYNACDGCGGAGIYNTGFLTLNHIVLSGNRLAYYYGGAIYTTGTLTANYLALLNNYSVYYGGGIYNTGLFTATYLTVSSSNTTLYDGGGIYNAGIMTLKSSILDGNNGARYGGAIYNGNTLTVINSTLTGNLSHSVGGGIFNAVGATLNLYNNTIAENATTGGGGGIYNNWDTSDPVVSGAVTLGNNIIVGNSAPVGTSMQGCTSGCTSGFTTKGCNLFGADGDSGVVGMTLAATDKVLADIIDTAIAPLDDNSGPTLTYNLVAGSPALNSGDNSLIPTGITTDQRGVGFPRIVGTKVDMGAVEYGTRIAYALTVSKSGAGTGTVTSTPAGISCGTTCSASFVANANVVLTAVATTGSVFANWGGDCVGITATTCSLAMNAVKSVSATFNLTGAVSLPTATTNAASNVTATSAVLNGQVNSNGATATISFDFGTTIAYGTSISAVPSTVYGNVNVAASKPGLTCGVTYHYRVKAVNSKGTSYGADRAFTTVACAVTRKWPDFVITSLTLTPATPVANGTFSLAVVVKNQGLRSADGGFLDVWANQATIPTCGAVGNKYADVGTIAVGASKTITVTGLPAGAKGANKTARAFVDSWCEIVESNETNNQMIKMYTVP